MSIAADRISRIRQALEQRFAPSALEILDDSAAHAGHAGAREGGHFRVTLVADEFRGRSRIERHRLVYDAVSHLMGSDIHAINIVARAPEQKT
jgi:BolA protein